MGIVCQLPTGVTIDDRISLIDLAARSGIEYHSRNKFPRNNDSITYSPAGIAPSDHPLRSLFLGRSLRDFNHYVARFARLDPEKTGTLTNRTLRQYIDRKENTDVDWTENDSTGCRLLPQIYAKWCHEITGTPPPAGEITENRLSGPDPKPSTDKAIRPSDPPSLWQLGWNFLVDRPEATGPLLCLIAGCALLLLSRGRRMSRIPQRITPAARVAPEVPPPQAVTVKSPRPSAPVVAKTAVAQGHAFDPTVIAKSPDGRAILGGVETIRTEGPVRVKVVGPIENAGDDDALSAIFGGRPTGRIEVKVLERSIPHPVEAGGGVGSEMTVVRKIADAIGDRDPERRVVIEMAGHDEELTAGRLKQYLKLRRSTISRLVEANQYNVTNDEARRVYAEMVDVFRVWHNGPQGFCAVPILPGGRLTLDQEARSLLRLHGALDLQGENFMITQAMEGPGWITMRQVRLAAEKLLHAAEEEPALRFKIHPLVETIYLSPYSLI